MSHYAPKETEKEDGNLVIDPSPKKHDRGILPIPHALRIASDEESRLRACIQVLQEKTRSSREALRRGFLNQRTPQGSKKLREKTDREEGGRQGG